MPEPHRPRRDLREAVDEEAPAHLSQEVGIGTAARRGPHPASADRRHRRRGRSRRSSHRRRRRGRAVRPREGCETGIAWRTAMPSRIASCSSRRPSARHGAVEPQTASSSASSSRRPRCVQETAVARSRVRVRAPAPAARAGRGRGRSLPAGTCRRRDASNSPPGRRRRTRCLAGAAPGRWRARRSRRRPRARDPVAHHAPSPAPQPVEHLVEPERSRDRIWVGVRVDDGGHCPARERLLRRQPACSPAAGDRAASARSSRGSRCRAAR